MSPRISKKTDPFYGIYDHSRWIDLDRMIKDDFNQFFPVKFENEKEEISKDLGETEDEFEKIKEKLKKELYDDLIRKRCEEPVVSIKPDSIRKMALDYEGWVHHLQNFT